MIQRRRSDGACYIRDLASSHGSFLRTSRDVLLNIGRGVGGGRRVRPGQYVPLRISRRGWDVEEEAWGHEEAADADEGGGMCLCFGASNR